MNLDGRLSDFLLLILIYIYLVLSNYRWIIRIFPRGRLGAPSVCLGLVFVVVIVDHVERAIVLEELATMLNLVLSEERSDDSIVFGKVREC